MCGQCRHYNYNNYFYIKLANTTSLIPENSKSISSYEEFSQRTIVHFWKHILKKFSFNISRLIRRILGIKKNQSTERTTSTHNIDLYYIKREFDNRYICLNLHEGHHHFVLIICRMNVTALLVTGFASIYYAFTLSNPYGNTFLACQCFPSYGKTKHRFHGLSYIFGHVIVMRNLNWCITMVNLRTNWSDLL